MVGKRSWAQAHSPYWSMHVEAWRQSGLSRAEYCRCHGLARRTFDKWHKHLVSAEDARKHAEYQAQLRREQRRKEQEYKPRRRPKPRFGANTDIRCRALQAYWAMHVEALNWSGMSISEYAVALNLSPYALRRWRNRLDDGEVEIDWRAHLHPSARPGVSDITNGRASERGLTEDEKADPGVGLRRNRRFFTDEQKRAIVQESERVGVTVSTVARRHGIAAGILFRWRSEFGIPLKTPARLAVVTLSEDIPAARGLQQSVRRSDGTVVADRADGRRVPVRKGSDPDAVRMQAGKEGKEP